MDGRNIKSWFGQSVKTLSYQKLSDKMFACSIKLNNNLVQMAIGFPAYHKKTFNPSSFEEFKEHLEESLAIIPFKIKQRSHQKIIFKSSMSIWSWGETIRIDFSDKESVSILSQCSFPLQLVDYGKNRENVELIIQKLQLESFFPRQAR